MYCFGRCSAVQGKKKAATRIESAVYDTLTSDMDPSTGTAAITKAVLRRLYSAEVYGSLLLMKNSSKPPRHLSILFADTSIGQFTYV
jgi:hypothetical protein